MKKFLGIASATSLLAVLVLVSNSALADNPPEGGSSSSSSETMMSSSSSSSSSISSSSSSSSVSSSSSIGFCLMDCGDGELDEHEECDDGNTIGSDGCSSTCMYEGPSTPLIAVCGDGIVEDGEMCDDGNTANDDECDSECAVQTRPVVFCLCLCRTFSRTNLCANSNPTNDPDIRCQERGFGPGGARSAQECINGEGMTCQGYSPGTGRRVQGTIRDCMPRVFNQ